MAGQSGIKAIKALVEVGGETYLNKSLNLSPLEVVLK